MGRHYTFRHVVGTVATLDQTGMKLKQSTDYNFAGQRVKNVKHEIAGPTPEGGIGGPGGAFRDLVNPTSADWTPCGKKDNVKINTDVVLKTTLRTRVLAADFLAL